MNDTFLAKLIKSNAKRRIKGLSLIVLFLLSLLAFDYKNINEYFFTMPNISKISDMKNHDGGYVTFSFLKDDFYDSGFSVFSKNYWDKTSVKKYFYGIIDVNDGFFLVKIPYNYYGRELFSLKLIGKLEKIDDEALIVLNQITPMNKDLDQDVLKELPSSVIRLAGADFILNKVKFILFLFLTVIFSFALFLEIIKYRNYKLAKPYRTLKNFGNPDEIEEIIEYETDEEERCIIARLHNIFVLKSFIIINDGKGISVIPTSDLLWIYKKKTIKNFFKEEFFIMLYFYEHSPIKIKVHDEFSADDFIYDVNMRLEIVAGYFKDVKKMYSKDKYGLLRIVNA